jgi:F-type H+-transporting ATPase subunit a
MKIYIIASPLDQFEIRNLISLDAPILANLHLAITNIALYLTIGTFIIFILSLVSTNYQKLVSNR